MAWVCRYSSLRPSDIIPDFEFTPRDFKRFAEKLEKIIRAENGGK